MHILTADVGGTHARIALIAPISDGTRPVTVLAYRDYDGADWPGLEAILQDFIDALEPSQRPSHGIIASAGYLLGDTVVNGSLPWPLSLAALRRVPGLAKLDIINDWVAIAHALAWIDPQDAHPLIAPAATFAAAGPRVAMGPGTGLGTAVLLPGSPPRVLATEAGQIALAARNERELAVLRRLLAGSDSGHVAYERVLSGPGLLALYCHLCALDTVDAPLTTPAAVTGAAVVGADLLAVEALAMFCAWLGSFCGDLAMLYSASGGLYLAGGILPSIHATLAASAFRERFLDKGVMRHFLERVPVFLLDHGRLGVLGAALWYRERDSAT